MKLDIMELQEVKMSKNKPCRRKTKSTMMRKMDIRKKKAGNISKIKGNQETSGRVYGRYWT